MVNWSSHFPNHYPKTFRGIINFMSTEVSLTIIAIGVSLLVIGLLIACIFLVKFLIVIKKTTQTVELRISPLIEEAKKIVSITSDTSERIKSNIELTTPLFQSIGKISSFIGEFPNRFKNDMHDNTMNVHFESKKGKIDLTDWAEWVALGIVLIQRLRK